MIRSWRSSSLLAAPAIVLMLLGLVLPSVVMLLSPPGTSLGDVLGRFGEVFTDGYERRIVVRTLTTALIVTGLCLLLGFPVAYLIARRPGRWAGPLLACAIFPLLLSTVVRTYGWLVVLGRNGVVGKVLVALGIVDEAPQLLYTRVAVVLGLAQLFLPLAIVSCYSSVAQIDVGLDEAARGLGATRTRCLRSVVIPLAMPGIALATTLVFAGSITAYTTPYLLGGSRQRVLSTQLFTYSSISVDWAAASATALVMILLVVVISGGFGSVARRKGSSR